MPTTPEIRKRIDGNELRSIGYPQGPIISVALRIAAEHFPAFSKSAMLQLFADVLRNPQAFAKDETLWPIADLLIPKPGAESLITALRDTGVPCTIFGKELVDAAAIGQMEVATHLPIALAGALMPDAHSGYGLPIGGVLATENAVIPYGVGVDIGCRMCLSVFPLPEAELEFNARHYLEILRHNTVFGAARDYTAIEDHEVIYDKAFDEIPFLKSLQETAQKQLGTSGGGNHFVEFGVTELFEEQRGLHGALLPNGRYLAVLSHSGSRGLGASIAAHYTKLALEVCKLPPHAKQLAWLSLNSEAGQEYWTAMTLAGNYASACHHIIHDKMARALHLQPVLRIENHHNFAWKETLHNREVIVHRKGATPAGKGVPAIIPGSMTEPGYIVRGKGCEASLMSASHGAGRRMSRTQAINTITPDDMKKALKQKKVQLIGGGPDEAPQAYKPITEVMSAQTDLVETIGLFYPRLVRME